MENLTKIKVAHIITRLDTGGSATSVIETAARLDKDKYATTLIFGKTISTDNRIFDDLQARDIHYICINHLVRNIHPLKDLKALFALFNIFKINKYDIIHTHSSKGGILGRWAAKFAGTKTIIHTPHGHIFYGYFNPFITFFFNCLERLTACFTDKIITLTNIGLQEHVNLKIAPKEKFITIYSGIDTERSFESTVDPAQLKDQYKILDEDFVYGCVARLDPIKGNDIIIDALSIILKTHPHSKVLLVGDGTDMEMLKNKVYDLQIAQHVIFAGHQENIFDFIHLMDVFVLASLNEGMGRALLEAMACKKPLIASNTGGIPELIKDDITGRLFPVGDSNALAKAMIEFQENKVKRDLLAISAHMQLSEKFSLTKMINDLDLLYQEYI